MKTLQFTRTSNNIVVNYQCNLQVVADLNENFVISRPSNIDSYLEKQLFYHLDRKKWTLNELIFFAKNNNLCLKIFDQQDNLLISYGACAQNDSCIGFFKVNNKCFLINNNPITIN